MISSRLNYYTDKRGRKHECVRAKYDDMADLAFQIARSDKAKAYQKATPNRWAGGSVAEFREQSQGRANDYTDRADKYLTRFGNVAIQTLGVDMDYNSVHGVLDLDAYENGEPECLYGLTESESESAPIRMYMDQWISSTVSPKAIEMRGVAALALLQALSLHRPVMLDIVLANRYTPTGTDIIQTVPAPTSPMNVSLAAWMVASPLFVRQGYMSMTYHHGNSTRRCGIPMLRAGQEWQTTQLGQFLADQDGVDDFVFMPMMMDNGRWTSEEYAINWIKAQMRRLLGDAAVMDNA